NRRCVLDAALVPQSIQAARDLEVATLTDVALEDFAIIADALDDGQGFMVRKGLNVKSALELSGAAVCVQSGTTTELNLA
ncbi:hypothetical protein ACC760_39385, partial [Rhizobium ruizarguesonis]